jgi:O-antigen/teichoic acid export membrane protein
MTAMCGATLLLSLFSREILTIFTTGDFVPGYQIVGLLALASVSYGAYSIVGIGAGLAQKTIHIGWVTVVAAALTILSNVVLARYFGIFGTAASTLLGNAAAACLLYRISQRCYPIPYDQRRILAIIGLTCLTGLIGIYCDHLFALSVTLALLKVGLGLAYATVMILTVLHPADVAAARAMFRHAILAREANK